MFSPFKVFVRYLLPAVSTDWLPLAFIVDVDFYVCVFAFAIPRVLTTFYIVGHGYSLVRV